MHRLINCIFYYTCTFKIFNNGYCLSGSVTNGTEVTLTHRLTTFHNKHTIIIQRSQLSHVEDATSQWNNYTLEKHILRSEETKFLLINHDIRC